MKCSKCGEELNEKWAVCPFCGTEVPKAPKSIGEILASVVEDYGPSIFKEENSSRLGRIMSDFPESVADDRDIIKLLQIKNIPDKLSAALDMPSEKQGSVVQECSSILCDKFGINGEKSAEMISLITNAISLKIEGNIAGSGNGTFKDPRDGHVYKTCKIGDQVWLAENLQYELDEGCLVYNGDYQYLDKYGYWYTYEAATKAVPEGWHIPTVQEIEKLEKFILKDKRCKFAGHHLAAVDESWQIDEKIEDSYGFGALPGGCQRMLSYSSDWQDLNRIGYFWANNPEGKDLWGAQPKASWALAYARLNDAEGMIISRSWGSYCHELFCSACSVRLIKD